MLVHKFPSSYIKDAFAYYKNKISEIKYMKDTPVTFIDFKRINRMFGDMLSEYVLLGREVGLPNSVGTIIIAMPEKKNRYMSVAAYSQPNKNIDFDSSVMLGRFGYKVRFRRNGMIPKPITGFKFIPSWSLKERLRILIKNVHGGRYSYLTSKTLHRDEI